MFNYEEKMKREQKILADFRELVATKLGGREAREEGQGPGDTEDHT